MIDFSIEKQFKEPVIGLDEVGRGPLAGPVISCGCLFNDYQNYQVYNKLISDSKKLSLGQRKRAFNLLLDLKKNKIINYHLGMASVKEIDKLNILEATKLSMRRAVYKFNIIKPVLIIDGNFKLEYKNIREKSVIKGDQKSISIAAASIIAKVHRDRLMNMLSKRYRNFNWDKNVGYGTKKHIQELRKEGPTIHHRKSYEPIKSLIKKF